MILQIPFDVIIDPVQYDDIHIKNGHQLNLSGKIDFNDIEIGKSPFFVTTKEHDFINDPVMIYTFFIKDNYDLHLESNAISSAVWITETNLPSVTGFIWPNIDSYFMLGFQPDILFVLESLTKNNIFDPILNIKIRSL